MNKKSILNRIYLPIMCLTVALSVSLRLAAMLTDYDLRVGYFNEKALITAASVAVVCGSVLLFTYAFVGNKSEKLIATFTTPSTYGPSAIIITALIFFATKAYSRIKDFELAFPAGIDREDAARYVSQNLSLYVTALLVPLALLAAVYFILNATVAERYSVARATFGVCTVLFLAIYASFLYFDTTMAINAPNKIVDQMAFIFASLFFLYEIRISLARECWHLYIAFGFIAATLGAYSSIPSIVMFFIKDAVISHSLEETLLTLCITLFIASRLVLACKLNPDKESEFVTAMRERADERNRYIVEKEEIERRAYIELYSRLSEIEEERPEVTNENELFGILPEQAADEATEPTEAPESEQAETAEAPEGEQAESAEAPDSEQAETAEAPEPADDVTAAITEEFAEAEAAAEETATAAEATETESDSPAQEDAPKDAENDDNAKQPSENIEAPAEPEPTEELGKQEDSTAEE